jgi:hypothetical protein
MADARLSQLVAETLTAVPPAPLTTTQLAVEVLNVVPNAPLAATQLAAEILFANPNDLRVTQIVYELIVLPGIEDFSCPLDFPIDPD